MSTINDSNLLTLRSSPNNGNKEKISSKIKNRLCTLTPSTSKESIQTFTKWILFHATTHPVAVCESLKHIFIIAIDVSSWSTMLNVYWNVLHEICYSYSPMCNTSGNGTGSATENDAQTNENKWNQYSEFRSRLAENVILPFLEYILTLLEQIQVMQNSKDQDVSLIGSSSILLSSLSSSPSNMTNTLRSMKELKDNNKLTHMHSVWKEVDSFQSPTLLDDIERVIKNIVHFDIDGLIENVGTTSNINVKINTRSVDNETATTSDTAHTTSLDATSIDKDDTLVGDDQSKSIATNTAFAAISSSKEERELESKQSKQQVDKIEDTGDSKETFDNTSIHTPTMDEDDDDNDMFETGDSDDNNNNNGYDDLYDNAKQSKMDIDTVEENKSEDKADKGKKSLDDGSVSGKKRSSEESNAEIDFEKEGIPKGKVSVSELIDPCKAIGTMQITRDLRNEFSHSLSSALSMVPIELFEACEKALASNDMTGESINLDEFKIPDEILDYDISDAISNTRIHRHIIEKQKECRQKVIELLLKSRCEFGSTDDAELFYALDDISKSLQDRLGQVKDAMELEGLDVDEMVDADGIDELEDSTHTSFTWLTKEEAKSNRDAKKLRSG